MAQIKITSKGDGAQAFAKDLVRREPPKTGRKEGVQNVKKILLIDDEEVVRSVVGEILKRAGYWVQTAADGKSGLELFQRDEFDLLITDLLMPETDGLETIMALRRQRKAMKIMAISGCGLTLGGEYLKIAEHLGADITLAKPFTQASLLTAVASLLGSPSQTPFAPAG
jgi:CheY-like chemotaxis protein